MKRSLLRVLSAEQAESIGLWLIISGLIGEAVLIFWKIDPSWEKPLTFVFTVAIALGVWIENVGASDTSSEKDARIAEATARASEAQLALERHRAPRSLDRDDFNKRIADKPKAPVEILFVRDDPECFEFSMQVRDFLKMAGWQVSEPQAISATENPRMAGYPSPMGVGGQPRGVSVVERTTGRSTSISVRTDDFWPDELIDTPAKAIAYALIGSLGHVSEILTNEHSESGVVRVVIGPKEFT